MARTFKRKEPMAAMTEINMTPLIDLAFALLIIFMITTPLLEQSIRINLPLDSAKPQDQRTPDFKTISIDAQGRIYWADEPVTLDMLSDILSQEAIKPLQPVISIRADATLQYQRVIDVVDLIKGNNLKKISLDTQAR